MKNIYFAGFVSLLLLAGCAKGMPSNSDVVSKKKEQEIRNAGFKVIIVYNDRKIAVITNPSNNPGLRLSPGIDLQLYEANAEKLSQITARVVPIGHPDYDKLAGKFVREEKASEEDMKR